jgi:hypothetical protein
MNIPLWCHQTWLGNPIIFHREKHRTLVDFPAMELTPLWGSLRKVTPWLPGTNREGFMEPTRH